MKFLEHFFFNVIVNWAFKLLAAWIVYSLMVWLGAPEWVIIAVTAVAAVDAKFKFQMEYA